MTLETAEKIRNLLNYRDELQRELKEYESCSSIDGHINDEHNGIGFRWDKGERQIQFLIDGTTKEIRNVETAIIKIDAEAGKALEF